MTDVYILKNSNDENISELKKLFVSSIFSVNEVIVPKPIGLEATKLMTMEDIYDAYQFQWCLAKTKEKNSKNKKTAPNSVLIVKSSSTTNANGDLIARLVNELNNRNDKFELFYLCGWKDECQKITDIEEIASTNIKIGRTYYPSGLQAIYFSPSGVDVILGNAAMRNNHNFNINIPLEQKLRYEILEGNIVAWCAIGNIFNYDLTKATSNSDYSKTHECDILKSRCESVDKCTKSSAFYNYIWVIAILIIIIICVIVILSIRK